MSRRLPAKRTRPSGVTTGQPSDPSTDHLDKIRQFLAGIEIYPVAGCVNIGQAPVFFALNPYQDKASLNKPAGWVVFRERLDYVFHCYGIMLARLPRRCQWEQRKS